jgi:transcriptional repressor NrdR
MRCPFCGNSDTQVVDSRVSEEGDTIRRRRRCQHCDKRFTTYERVELVMPSVVKRNGARSDFDAGKLRGSLMLALRKRPVGMEEVDAAVARIEETLLTSGKREVPSAYVGELVMAELKKLDKVAYVRFASVYRSFEDIGEFIEAIREMQGPLLRQSALQVEKDKKGN